MDDGDHGDNKVLPSVDHAKQILHDTLKLCWMRKISQDALDSSKQAEVMKSCSGGSPESPDKLSSSVVQEGWSENGVNSISTHGCLPDKKVSTHDSLLAKSVLVQECPTEKNVLTEEHLSDVCAVESMENTEDGSSDLETPVYLEFDKNLTSLMLQANCQDMHHNMSGLKNQECSVLENKSEMPSVPMPEMLQKSSTEQELKPSVTASDQACLEENSQSDKVLEDFCHSKTNFHEKSVTISVTDTVSQKTEETISQKIKDNISHETKETISQENKDTISQDSIDAISGEINDVIPPKINDTISKAIRSDEHSQEIEETSGLISISCQTNFPEVDCKEPETVTKGVQTRQKMLVVHRHGKISRATQTHGHLKLNTSGTKKGSKPARSKSLQRDRGNEECNVKWRCRKKSDGCLQDVSFVPDAERQISEQEHMFLSDNSPEMQVVVNSSTPVLVRRKSNLRHARKELTHINGAHGAMYQLQVDENQNFESDVIVDNKNLQHSHTKLAEKPNHRSGILKEKNSSNDHSVNSNSAHSSPKQSIIISPEMSRTWHGTSGTLLRPAPRMGLGMVNSESTPYFSYKRFATFGSHSMAEMPGEIGRGFPYISRSLLDAMHKRYYSNYSPHQYSSFNGPMNPVVDSTAHALPAPIVAPVVQPPTRLDLRVDDSDSTNSPATSVQSSPRSQRLTPREITPDSTPTLQKVGIVFKEFSQLFGFLSLFCWF